MDRKEKDPFIEEVDRELRSIDARLRKALAEANALLQEHRKDTEETAAGHEEGIKED